MVKNINTYLVFSLLFLLHWHSVTAQDCNVLAPGSEAGFDQIGFCAPVTGRVKYFTFYTLQEVATDKLEVEINWGESKKRYKGVEAVGYNATLKAWEYRLPETTYVYEADRKNPKCSYPVTIKAVIDKKVCNSPMQTSTVIVWDKDNANGGSLVINPKEYFACPGSEILVEFEDKSTWNCVPNQEKIHMNWPSRSTQFVYGTTNTITGAVKVNEELIAAWPLEGPVNEHEEKAQKPSLPFSKSARITIPATAQVGEKFEITLNNWNYCNQRPDDPIQQKAVIEIVAQPVGEITIQNKPGNNATAFCPNEEIILTGSYRVDAGEVDAGDVRYDWEITDLRTQTVQTFDDTRTVNLANGFPKPGFQKVILKVSNRKANTGPCLSTTEETIELIDAPAVVSEINGQEVNELSFCAGSDGNIEYPVTFKHRISSSEDFTYSYQLYKRNSTANSPDSALNIPEESGVNGIEREDSVSFIFTQAGLYRLRVVAKNNSTGCSSVEESRVAVYEDPVPDFTIKGFCAGLPVSFTDASFASPVPGDEIVSWEWDMDYTAENREQNSFNTDKSGKETFSWIYNEAGTYTIALKITNGTGCSSVRIKSFEVKASPVALLSSNYSGHLICPLDTIRFTNESFLSNSAALFPEGVSYTLMVSDGVATKEVLFKEGQEYIDYPHFYNPDNDVLTYSVWLRAKGIGENTCALDSEPVKVKVRHGAAAGYTTTPFYSPFGPNCSPKVFYFETTKATRELQAESYRWTILLKGEIVDEIRKERSGDPSFETLEYSFVNTGIKYLDYEVILSPEKEGVCINPAVNTYRVYPNPVAKFTATPALYACDSVVYELKVNFPPGISDYQWEFSEQPANDAATGLKDDHFFVSWNRNAFGEEPKEYTITLRATNFYGCSGEWTEKVTVNPVVVHKPLLELKEISGSGCRPVRATFLNKTIGDNAKAKYEFYIENTATSAMVKIDDNDIEGEVKGEFSYTFREAGNFKAWLKVSAGVEEGECQRSFSAGIPVTVAPDPLVKISAYPAEGCGAFTATISKSIQNSIANTWTVTDVKNGGIIYGPETEAGNSGGVRQYKFENTSGWVKRYRVKVMGQSAAGCSAGDSVEVVVYPALQPSFTLDSREKDLSDALFQITNTTPFADNWSTSWSFGNGDTSSAIQPGNYQYTNFGKFMITLTVSNGFCSESFAMEVNVEDAIPDVSFAIGKTEGCWPVTVNFTNTSRFANESGYFWDFGDGIGTSTANHPVYIYTKPGNYKVTLSAVNASGTKIANAMAEEVVRVFSMPRPDFEIRKEVIYAPEEPVVVANYSERAVWYRWDFGDGTIYEGSEHFEPIHYYKNPGVYDIKLVVQTEKGCMDSVTVHRAITAKGGGTVTLPNAFTPGKSGSNGGLIEGAGQNDVFYPVLRGGVQKYKMQVFNRWGELVYETQDVNKGWDGYYKGRLCVAGIYIYKIHAELNDGKTINKTGDLMLIQ